MTYKIRVFAGGAFVGYVAASSAGRLISRSGESVAGSVTLTADGASLAGRPASQVDPEIARLRLDFPAFTYTREAFK